MDETLFLFNTYNDGNATELITFKFSYVCFSQLVFAFNASLVIGFTY